MTENTPIAGSLYGAMLLFSTLAALFGGIMGPAMLHAYLATDDAPRITVVGTGIVPSGIPGVSAVSLELDGADTPADPDDVKLASGGRLLENECPTAAAPCFLAVATLGGTLPMDGIAVSAEFGSLVTVIPTADGRTCMAEYGKYGKCSEYNTAGRPTVASGFGEVNLWTGLAAAIALAFGVFGIRKAAKHY